MANRLNDIRGLAEYHATEITDSPKDWMNYLDTAARFYRYPFSDQLLIHAQRPNATACASLEFWNEKMMRWVNRGAKGIALIDDTRPKVRLRYVFDVKDTHMVRGGKTPHLWELPERHEEAVKEHLADVYDLHETATLSGTLMELAKQLTEENLQEMMDGLSYVTEDTFLEGLDEDYLRVSFRTQVENSVFYMLARRCGLDPMDMLEENDFRGIIDYNRLSVLSYVGNSISQLTEPVLIDIGRTVTKYLQQEQAKEIDFGSDKHYNALKRESDSSNNTIKGGLGNGDDISSQGGLPVPESDNRERGDMDRQVRNASPDIPEGKPEESVSEPSSDGETTQASAGDRGERSEENGEYRGGTAEDLSGSEQGDKPDGMGGTHEQPESDGGRDHLDGIGVQLISKTSEDDLSEAEEEIASALALPELSSVEEQIRAIEALMEAAFSADSQIPTEVVDEILRMGGNRNRSPLRLIYNYMIEQTPDEYADFVKREYGHGGQGVIIDGQEYSVWFNEFEMKIAKGNTANDNQSDRVTLSWEEVSDRIHQLLRQGEYAPQSVLDAAYDNILSEYARALIYMERDMAEGVSELVFEDTEIFRGGFPDAEDRVTELLTHAEFREDIRDRLEALAEIYQEDHSVMRFTFYHPERMAELFEKLTREAVPFRSVPGFSWKDPEVFITEDEIIV